MVVGHLEITQLIIDCSFSMRNPVGNYIDCATPTTPSPAQMASDPQDYEWEICLLQIWLLTLMCLYGEYYPSVRCIMLCQTASIQAMHAGQIKDLTYRRCRTNQRPQYRDAGQIKDLTYGWFCWLCPFLSFSLSQDLLMNKPNNGAWFVFF